MERLSMLAQIIPNNPTYSSVFSVVSVVEISWCSWRLGGFLKVDGTGAAGTGFWRDMVAPLQEAGGHRGPPYCKPR